MQTNNHKLEDYDLVLDKKYGEIGTKERLSFEQEARAYYASQLLLNARKEASVTQSELAKRSGVAKTYISKIENGLVEPSVSLFIRLISALGMRLDISRG